MTELLFWTCAGVLAYAYAGFPLLLAVRARAIRRPVAQDDATPAVSVIVCAYNEAATIGEKLRNLLACDYPADRLEVVVASDGSEDDTEAVVSACRDPRVRLLALPRRGKIPALNAAAHTAKGEILVFSDANSMYAPDALRRLVGPFADPHVGGVAGDQRYVRGRDAAASAAGERAYWSIDRAMKVWQSSAGSVTSATGAIYAVRRSLFRPVPLGVTDDFFVSAGVVAAGRRLVFRRDAVAYESVAAASTHEFRRKVRVISRGLRAVAELRELLDPRRHGFYALQMFSHKVLRRLAVFPLAALLVASLALWDDGPSYRVAALVQIGGYGAAAAIGAARARGRAHAGRTDVAVLLLSGERRVVRRGTQPRARAAHRPLDAARRAGGGADPRPRRHGGVHVSAVAIGAPAPARAHVPLSAAWLFVAAVACAGGAMLAATGRPLAGLLAAAAVPAALVVLRRRDAAAVAVAFLLYVNAGPVAVNVHGVPWAAAAALPLLLLVPLGRALVRDAQPLLVTPVLCLAFAYACVQFVSSVFAARPDVAIAETVTTLAEGVLLYFLVANAVRSTASLRAVCWALLAAGVFLGALTIWQHATGTYASSYGGFAQCSELEHLAAKNVVLPETLRQDGPLGEPNRYAQIMAMLLPLSAGALWTRKRRLEAVLAVAAAAVIGFAAALALSRGVMLGLAAALFAGVAAGYVPVRYVLACALAAVLVFFAVPRFAERIGSLADVAGFVSQSGPVRPAVDGAVRSRATEMKAAVLMFLEHPLIGVGPGNYAHHYQSYARRVGGKVKLEQRRSHSLYLDLAAETGVAGLAVFSVMAAIVLRDLRRARARWHGLDPDRSHLATALLCAVLIFLTTSLFLHLAYARYFWLFVALAGAAAYAPIGVRHTAPAAVAGDRAAALARRERPRPVSWDLAHGKTAEPRA